MQSKNSQLNSLLHENNNEKIELEDIVKRQMTELQMIKEEITFSQIRE